MSELPMDAATSQCRSI